jgi:hypothetical protein
MSPLSPGTKENVQLSMKEFGQPSIKQDYTNSLECCMVNPICTEKYIFVYHNIAPTSDDTTYFKKRG